MMDLIYIFLFLQTLESSHRRKDIYQALTSHMAEIFDFFLRLIDHHVTTFRQLKESNNPRADAHKRVVQVSLCKI